jgi:hypothetical protein
VLRRIVNLSAEVRSFIDDLTDVIACFNGMLEAGGQLQDEEQREEFESYNKVMRLSETERRLVTKVERVEDISIDDLVGAIHEFLITCSEVLDELTHGISMGTR